MPRALTTHEFYDLAYRLYQSGVERFFFWGRFGSDRWCRSVAKGASSRAPCRGGGMVRAGKAQPPPFGLPPVERGWLGSQDGNSGMSLTAHGKSRHGIRPSLHRARTALLSAHILPVFSLIAPGPAGAGTVSVLAGLSPRTVECARISRMIGVCSMTAMILDEPPQGQLERLVNQAVTLDTALFKAGISSFANSSRL